VITLRVVFNDGTYEDIEFVTEVFTKDGALVAKGVDYEWELPGGKNVRTKVSFSLHAIKRWGSI